jgi:23S rRNA pseudouridine1911/1915/1917 synthase
MKIDVLYEDNHLIAVNKPAGMPVQDDITGDESLLEAVKVFIKKRDNKPGNVFLGLIHRLDRPTTGIVVFAKTSKALSRMNELIRNSKIEKIYYALTIRTLKEPTGKLEDFLWKNQKNNKSQVVDSGKKGAKKAVLEYELTGSSDNYSLYKIRLITGRHHQIRVQLSSRGAIIKGDLKYGASRSNRDGSIDLFAGEVSFIHPVTKEQVVIKGIAPASNIWNYFRGVLK